MIISHYHKFLLYPLYTPLQKLFLSSTDNTETLFLSTSHTLSQILKTNQENMYYFYPHFTDEQTGSDR